MVAQLLTKERAKFRIVIREVDTGKSKTISLVDSDNSLKDIVKHIENCFRRKK